MAQDRVSSSSFQYNIGNLSSFPVSIDDRTSLFTAINTGTTRLIAPISFESMVLPVKSTEDFPPEGLVVIDQEVIYYREKSEKFFSGLTRGFAGKRSPHELDSEVMASVCADHHNAIRDGIINIQHKIGLIEDQKEASTIYGRLKALEDKFLTLRAVFSTSSREYQPGEVVSFKDRSVGLPVSWLWDFGDGGTSTDRNPVHRYAPSADGSSKMYDVTLTVTDLNGLTSMCKKNMLIKVGIPEVLIYADQREYIKTGPYVPVTLYDQSPGVILARRWSFGDGQNYISTDPDGYKVTHNYTKTGSFRISIVVETPYGVGGGPGGQNEVLIRIVD